LPTEHTPEPTSHDILSVVTPPADMNGIASPSRSEGHPILGVDLPPDLMPLKNMANLEWPSDLLIFHFDTDILPGMNSNLALKLVERI
jgi:hypothetical protein